MSVKKGCYPAWTKQTLRITIDEDSSDEEDDLLPESEPVADVIAHSKTIYFRNLPVPLSRALDLGSAN